MRMLLLAVALFAAGLPRAVAADESTSAPRIYRWIDENGIAHYTTDPDRIPKGLRRRFGLPAEPLRREAVDPRAPSGDPDTWAAEEKREAPPTAPSAATTGAASHAPRPAGEWNEGSGEDLASLAGPERLAELELRIAELSAAIAADEDALAAYIADPSQGDAVAVADQPAFREIATRLPKRIQELEALQSERDALQSATP